MAATPVVCKPESAPRPKQTEGQEYFTVVESPLVTLQGGSDGRMLRVQIAVRGPEDVYLRVGDEPFELVDLREIPA